jgi:hypothetical protein
MALFIMHCATNMLVLIKPPKNLDCSTNYSHFVALDCGRVCPSPYACATMEFE